MCDQCKVLEEELKVERKQPKLSSKNWWAGIVVTIIIFVGSLIYASGKVASQIEDHIKNDPTYQELMDKFATKDDLTKTEKNMNDKLDLILKLLGHTEK